MKCCNQEMTRHVPNWGQAFYICEKCHTIRIEELDYSVRVIGI